MDNKNKVTEGAKKLLKVKNSKPKDEEKSDKIFKEMRLKVPMSKYEFDEGRAMY